jgi:2-phospho-L-lactate guanylyltransferase
MNPAATSVPTWAIVPVKSLAEVKQRLAPVLPLDARRRLVLTMLEDVLAALAQVETLGPVLVVTPDATVAELAERRGALILREPRGRGHSAAALAGFAEARAHGAAQALTLPADVPLVTPAELVAVLAAARSPSPRLRGEGHGGAVPPARGEGRPQVPSEPVAAPHPSPLPTEEWGEGTAAAPRITLVPSRDGDGTNGLLLSPPGAFAPSFGPGSFARHLVQAAERGIACRTVRLPGLGLDIDEPHDLYELMRRTRANPRYAFLVQYGLVPAEAMEP